MKGVWRKTIGEAIMNSGIPEKVPTFTRCSKKECSHVYDLIHRTGPYKGQKRKIQIFSFTATLAKLAIEQGA